MKKYSSQINLFCILFWMFGIGCGGALVVFYFAMQRDAVAAWLALIMWLFVAVITLIPGMWIHNWDINGDKDA